MRNFLKKLVKRELANTDTLIVKAARMEDHEIIALARRLDKSFGSTAQGDRLRSYLDARRKHFRPFSA